METESPLKERVDECHGTEEFDEALKGVMGGGSKPIAFGEEGAVAGSNLMLSPRWRMIEGLSEVGASTSNPRRSVRINARVTKVGASSNHRHGMSSASISMGISSIVILEIVIRSVVNCPVMLIGLEGCCHNHNCGMVILIHLWKVAMRLATVGELEQRSTSGFSLEG
ncbi:hypothetical protein ACSQ67_025093 [Phaseolus vulgaris]